MTEVDVYPYLFAMCLARHRLVALALAWRIACRSTWIWQYMNPVAGLRRGLLPTIIPKHKFWIYGK